MIKVKATDIEMSFDIVGEDHGALVFTIRIEFSPNMQKIEYILRNVRIEKSDFNDFEVQLAAGSTAELIDINACPVLIISKGKKHVEVEVQPPTDLKDSEYSNLNINMHVDQDLVGKLAAAFKKYPKWW